jgi:acetyl-CoA acetyltransferase family protein
MNNPHPLAVIDGRRTPFAKSFSDLANKTAVDLGVHAVKSAVTAAFGESRSLSIKDIDQVVMGNVAGQPDAANMARVISLLSGLPHDRVAHTVNRNCASGMESILSAWDLIQSGRADMVVAGGTESMSNIPMLFSRDASNLWMRLAKAKTTLQRLRVMASFRPRHLKPINGIQLGLTDPVSGLNMGETAEILAREFSITREEQDAFALRSHQLASSARHECFFSGEISPIELENGRTFEKDNGPRSDQSLDQLAKLRPIFDRRGSVTAGNSCPLTDGAAALVVAPAPIDRANRFPHILGYITHCAIAGCDPRRMGLGPVYATAKLMRESGLRISDFDLVEMNEAFAAQVIACQKAFASDAFAKNELHRTTSLGEIDPDRLNVNGGAIALGHPVGTTGTRLILTLLRALQAAGKKRGLATLCVGGGQGVAMVVQTSIGD